MKIERKINCTQGSLKSQFVNEKARMMVSILEVEVCCEKGSQNTLRESLDSVPYVIQNMFNFDLHVCDSWSCKDTIVDYKLHLESFIVHRHRYRLVHFKKYIAYTYPECGRLHAPAFLFKRYMRIKIYIRRCFIFSTAYSSPNIGIWSHMHFYKEKDRPEVKKRGNFVRFIQCAKVEKKVTVTK